MKKVTALLLSMAMGMCLLAGCGNASTGESESSTAAAESGITTVTEGTLTMATNAYFPPYEYYEGSEIVGIDAEIAAAVAEKPNVEPVKKEEAQA